MCIALITGAALAGDGPPPGPPASGARAPADFKIRVALYGVRTEPVARAEVVVRRGVAYRFVTELPRDVLIVDPATARVRLVDLRRKVQTEWTSGRLDATIARHRARLMAVAASQEKSGTRSGRVIASMTRDLLEPNFRETPAPDGKSVRLANESVQVDASGESEADTTRLALVYNALAASAQVDAVRDPDDLPPFVLLDALRALARRRLRPTEVRCVYRLTGPPKTVRWSYAIVPTLTDREAEAVARIDRLCQTAPLVPYERFEADDESDNGDAPSPAARP